ncbi:hypothetical protein [Aestuariirhabdus litorea]|uniref:Transcriptional regulator SutA RNAP-binding domain-containing protein n=1 Tax=Aestuariirhabdus litorea TaxID=2528527 RepID=A0A3P3VQM0_9GAMM|nr:hypothetical protein [Aestuariirhabdus litorea]RRJ84258.1 hypothetical protein D0544_03885 [Aestuariirhabdus litorea]RWW97480.1 hypothetical protein DZC74_03885 [Endozoicomonadaceae bacterium GTF-13]
MAARPRTAATRKQPQEALETSKSIADQTRAFLEAGGEIEKVKQGVSGMQSMAGSRHITLGNNRPSEKPKSK